MGILFCCQYKNLWWWLQSLKDGKIHNWEDVQDSSTENLSLLSQFTLFSYRFHSFICKNLGFLGNFFSFIYVILDVGISIESKCGIERNVFGFSKDSVGTEKVNKQLNLLSELKRIQHPTFSNPSVFVKDISKTLC